MWHNSTRREKWGYRAQLGLTWPSDRERCVIGADNLTGQNVRPECQVRGPCSALRGRPAGAWTPSSPATRRHSADRSHRGICSTSGARRTTSKGLAGADLFTTTADRSDAASRITRSSHCPTVSPSRRAAITAMSRASVDIDLMVHGCILSMGSRTPWSSKLQTCLTARDATDSWQVDTTLATRLQRKTPVAINNGGLKLSNSAGGPTATRERANPLSQKSPPAVNGGVCPWASPGWCAS